MARYRFTGESPVIVPELARFIDHPVQPGEEFETDREINNSFFDLVSPAPAPAEANSKPQESEA